MIRVNNVFLDIYISELRQLAQSNNLKTITLNNSKGEVATKLIGTYSDVIEVNNLLNMLINNTVNLFENIESSFKESDLKGSYIFEK